ncbi:MAG: MBG domain-containing protein, partial [Anaeroplasmataceae bacterium]
KADPTTFEFSYEEIYIDSDDSRGNFSKAKQIDRYYLTYNVDVTSGGDGGSGGGSAGTAIGAQGVSGSLGIKKGSVIEFLSTKHNEPEEVTVDESGRFDTIKPENGYRMGTLTTYQSVYINATIKKSTAVNYGKPSVQTSQFASRHTININEYQELHPDGHHTAITLATAVSSQSGAAVETPNAIGGSVGGGQGGQAAYGVFKTFITSKDRNFRFDEEKDKAESEANENHGESHNDEVFFNNYSNRNYSHKGVVNYRSTVDINYSKYANDLNYSTQDDIEALDTKIYGLTLYNNVTTYGHVKNDDPNNFVETGYESNLAFYSKPTIPGYKFKGYYAARGEDLILAIDEHMRHTSNYFFTSEDKIFYAFYAPIEYEIQYDSVDKDESITGTVNNTQGVFDNSYKIAYNSFKKPGYDFIGWATTVEKTTKGIVDYEEGTIYRRPSDVNPYLENVNVSMEHKKYESNVTLYAVWKQNVKFNLNGASADANSNVLKSIDVYWNQTLTEITGGKPRYFNFVFMGYNFNNDATGTMVSDSENKFLDDFKIWNNRIGENGEIELFSMWKITTTLNFVKGFGSTEHSNPGTYTKTVTSYMNGVFNFDPFNLEMSFEGMKRKGYSLVGYSRKNEDKIFLDAEGNGEYAILPGLLEEDYLNLYSVFKENEYEVSFDINNTYRFSVLGNYVDETFEDYELRSEIKNQKFDHVMNSVEIPIMPGFTFRGFYSSKNGGLAFIDSQGQATNRTWIYDESDNFVLYARWDAVLQNVNVLIEGNDNFLEGQNVKLVRKTSYENKDHVAYFLTQNKEDQRYTGKVPRGEYYISVGEQFYKQDYIIEIVDEQFTMDKADALKFYSLNVAKTSDGNLITTVTVDQRVYSIKKTTTIWVYSGQKVSILGSPGTGVSTLVTYTDDKDSSKGITEFLAGYSIDSFTAARKITIVYNSSISSFSFSVRDIKGNTEAGSYAPIIDSFLVEAHSDLLWYDEYGILLKPNDIIRYGFSYTIKLTVKPLGMNTFPQDLGSLKVSVTANNKVFTLDSNQGLSYDENNYVVCEVYIGNVEKLINNWTEAPQTFNFEFSLDGSTFVSPRAKAKAGEVLIEYSQNGIDWTTEIPYNAGVYKVRFSIPPLEEYNDLEPIYDNLQIFKKILNYDEKSAGIVEYSGLIQESELDSYYEKDRTRANTLVAQVNKSGYKDVGSYIVTVTILEEYRINYVLNTINNNNPELALLFVIIPVSATIVINDYEIVYGQNSPDYDYEILGLVGEDTKINIFDDQNKLNVQSKYSVHYSDTRKVGEYIIYLESGYNAKNYNITIQNGVLTVVKKDLQLLVEDSEFIYGDETVIDYLLSGTEFGEQAFEIFGNNSLVLYINSTKVGKHQIYLDDSVQTFNYNLIYNNDSYVNIVRRELIIRAERIVATYGTKYPNLTYSYSGLAYNDTFQNLKLMGSTGDFFYERLKLVTNYDYSSPSNREVGIYYLEFIEPGNLENYYVTYVDSVLEITKSIVTVIIDDFAIFYGDKAPSNDEITYNVSGTQFNDILENIVKLVFETQYVNEKDHEFSRANSYAITLQPMTLKNYDFIVHNGELKVQKRITNLVFTQREFFYGQSDLGIEFDMDNIAYNEKDALLATVSYSFTHSDKVVTEIPAGKYLVSLEGFTSFYAANYNVIFDEYYIEVHKQNIIVTIDDFVITYGDVEPTYTYSIQGALERDKSVIARNIRLTSEYDVFSLQHRGADIYAIVFDIDFFNANMEQSLLLNYNYSLESFVLGELTVEKAKLSVSAVSIIRNYGYKFREDDFLTDLYGHLFDEDYFIDVKISFET